jgi:hypothetical protein
VINEAGETVALFFDTSIINLGLLHIILLAFQINYGRYKVVKNNNSAVETGEHKCSIIAYRMGAK